MNKKNSYKEVFFIITTILFIVSICLFNYIINPYSFYRTEFPRLVTLPRDLIYPYIDSLKNKKYNTVIIGSSQAGTLYNTGELNKKGIAVISFGLINYKILYEILNKYIPQHKETKTLIIGIEQPILFFNDYENITDNSNKYLENMIRLLFSYTTTKDSAKSLIRKLKENNKINFNFIIPQAYAQNEIENSNNIPIMTCYPYLVDTFEGIKYSKELMNYHYEYIDKIIELAKNNNIEYKFILLPVHSSVLAYIDKKENLKHILNDIKNYIIKKNAIIYDLQFANKYTNLSMFDTDNCLWYDRVHPYQFWSNEVYKILFDENNADKDLYFKISKDNYQEVLNKEQELLDQYIKNNQKDLNYYDLLMSSKEYEKIMLTPVQRKANCLISIKNKTKGLSDENKNDES